MTTTEYDWRSVPVPPYMRSLPRDPRGYPIPWSIMSADGTYDFRIVDSNKFLSCVAGKLCALCGHSMGRKLVFIGGPLSVENRLFTDPAMHRDCAQYALKVCPFLAIPKARYSARDIPADVHIVEGMADHRPDNFFMYVTHSFRLTVLPDRSAALLAGPAVEIIPIEENQHVARA